MCASQKQIEDVPDFPNKIIKKPDLQDFEMLSYDIVPNYDPSEGIEMTIVNFHPSNHPSYPHYCYPVYEFRYDKWLQKTSVFTIGESKMIPVHDEIKPEVCVCRWTQSLKYFQKYLPGCLEIKCKFTEDNPVCPIRPRCIGCNYMFKYDMIQKHLKENPSCYNEYTSESYSDLENICHKLMCTRFSSESD